jgi:hypothetical protein
MCEGHTLSRRIAAPVRLIDATRKKRRREEEKKRRGGK